MPGKSEAHAAATATKAGSAITSRESHEVRHCEAARHARAGRPRWKNDATRPRAASERRDAAASANAALGEKDGEVSFDGERGDEQSLPRAAQRGEQDY